MLFEQKNVLLEQEKSSTPTGLVWDQHHGRRLISLEHLHQSCRDAM